jgi:putative transposase
MYAMSRNLEFGIGEFYHVYNRGVEKRVIFLDEADHKRFVKLLYTANSTKSVHLSNYQGLALIGIPRGQQIVAVGAWCIMPNHFHLLLKESIEGGISQYMHKLLTGYTMYFNKKYRRKGALFEGTFNVRHLDSDEYLKYQYAYIHLNPIGIIDAGWKNKKIKDKNRAKKFLNSYQYSSFQDHAGSKRDESLILEPKHFPEYFKQFVDFNNMIEEWVCFENINIKA